MPYMVEVYNRSGERIQTTAETLDGVIRQIQFARENFMVAIDSITITGVAYREYLDKEWKDRKESK